MNAKFAKAVSLFIGLAILSAIRAVGQVQTTSPTASNVVASSGSGYVCLQRGPDSKVWQQAVMLTNADGDVSTNFQSFTELATGICYTNSAGQLVDSVEQVESVEGGAQALQGPHKVQWAFDANTPGGTVAIQTPDGKQLSCKVLGLAYYDLSSGSNAAIAQLQDSQGSILPPNQVIYRNAFSNITTDILYTYTRDGLSQDVVFRQAPPPPDAFGLSDSNTVLQVYSQFINTPEPTATAVTNGNVLDDEVLSFGAMQMGVGDSVFIDGNQTPLTLSAVQKQWIHVNNNTYLVESVPWSAISNQVEQLHPASNLNPKRASIRGLALFENSAINPASLVKERSPMMVAKAALEGRKVVVDWVLLSGAADVTLQGDQTYLVSGAVNITDVLTIEGGTVVKYTTNGQINVTGTGSNIVCQTGPYRPAVFTSVYDGSVGASISNGTPVVTANTYLNFTLAGTQPLTLRYLRFSYAATAVAGTVLNASTTDWIKLWDCQFFDCGTGFGGTMNESVSMYVYNVLFSTMTNGLAVSSSNNTTRVTTQNVTADNLQYYTFNINGLNVSAVNSIFTAVSHVPTLPSITTNCAQYSSGSGLYTNVGGASYYLTALSTNRNWGVTLLDAGLLADLQTLTTYPPRVISTYITVNSNLGPIVPRNTGVPDIGYHYSPIDWALNVAISNASVVTLSVSNGTVLAGFGSYAIWLNTNGIFDCNGTATSPVYLVKYNTVQEQSNTNWAYAAGLYGSLKTPTQIDSSAANMNFTVWSVFGDDFQIQAGNPNIPCTVTLTTCQFYSGQVSLSGQTLVSSNCLFARVAGQLLETGGASDANTFCNNLLWNGSLTVKHSGGGTWTFRDNLFDQCDITNKSSVNSIDCLSNAYATNLLLSPQLLPGDLYPVHLTASPAYQTGALGQFYYPSSQTNLIFYGSQLASAVGLSDFTVTTNNVGDGTNLVSIGFHYPTPPGPSITAEPTSVSANLGGSATFSVTATGVAPLTYQWYQNGVLLAGDTGSSLSLTSLTAASAGAYEVVVSDPLGTTASWIATLKVAQNNFFVNYWNSSAVSPISPMIRGTDPLGLAVPPTANVVQQATPKASLRGVQPGTDADTYNWMELTSQGNSSLFLPPGGNYNVNSANPNVNPFTTLQVLQLAYSNNASLIFTVNSRGDGYLSGTTWYQNTYTNGHLEMLASNWVRYCNYIVQHYCWSNGIVMATNGAPPLSGNDTTIMTTLTNYWVAGNGTSTNPTKILPTLLSYSNFVVLPTVRYWEIGNEVDGQSVPIGISTNWTIFTATNYDTNYKSITKAMLSVDPTIQVGPGFGGPFTNNSLIDPLLSDSNAVINFLVYHPYPGNEDSDYTNNNLPALAASLEGINTWQNDTVAWQMDKHLVTNGLPVGMPLFATEWSGSCGAFNSPFASSMWTMLANAETLLCQVKGQRTLLSTFYYSQWIDPNSPDWPLLYPQLQSYLGNVYLSSSYGDGVPTTYGPPGDGNTNAIDGSLGSPFRIYSTMDTNSGKIFVWMLNLTNSGNQTVDLHFPAGISSGTLYTLTNSTTAPSFMVTNNYGSANFFWLTNPVTWASGNSVVLTNSQATLTVGQFTLANAPASQNPPVIAVLPPRGQPGQIITITGSNFSPVAAANTVYFGPVRGVVTAATATNLNVQVPFGSAYGPVTVTVSNLTAYSTTFFNPAYYGTSAANAITFQAARTNMFTNTMSAEPFWVATELTYFDADGDGKGDLAYTGVAYPSNAGLTGMFENQSGGAGSFVLSNTPYSLPVADNPGGTAFGDFDGDGLLDWVVVVNGLTGVQVCRNASTPGNIFFEPGGRYITGLNPADVKVMDIDGDGRPDLIVANQDDNTVSVYRNLSTGPGSITFAQKVDFPACPGAQFLAVGDFDGDGKPDIAVSGNWIATLSNVVVLRNLSTPGNISFASPTAVATLNIPCGIAAGDFNNDGKLDLAVSVTSIGPGQLNIYRNYSTAGSISFAEVLPALNTGDAPQGLAVGDLNGDGWLDIVVASVGAGNVGWASAYQNQGTGSFASPSNYTTGSGVASGPRPFWVVLADMDGDGRPDMAVANYYTTNVIIFQNTSQY